MPEQEQRQQPCGQEFAKDQLEKGAGKLFNHVESKCRGPVHAHGLCVLTYGVPGRWAVSEEMAWNVGGIIICSQWMSCETDFYIV